MKKSTIIAPIGVILTALGYFVLYPANQVVGFIASLVGCACAVSGLILTIKGK